MNSIGPINKMYTFIRFQNYLVSSLIIFCVASSCAFAEEDQSVVKKYSAVAKKAVDFGVGAQTPKIEFKFDNGTAWLRENGTFQVDVEIKHGSLLCGTYEVGMRFGIGNPACTNVSWLSETKYVTKRKQCNHAWMGHQGSGTDPEVVGDFELLTCAQLVVKCTGKCKNF